MSKPAIPALLLLLTGCSQALGPTELSAPSRTALSRTVSSDDQVAAGEHRQVPGPNTDPSGFNPLKGFNPLPTPQQVVAAMTIGRGDPFAPVSPAPASSPQIATLPQGFRFTGVVRGPGRAQALVQFGSLSGTLQSGQIGGRTTDLLPPGWMVTRVDGLRGRLTLRQGSQQVTADL